MDLMDHSLAMCCMMCVGQQTCMHHGYGPTGLLLCLLHYHACTAVLCGKCSHRQAASAWGHAYKATSLFTLMPQPTPPRHEAQCLQQPPSPPP
jgi:hypothetical protein